MYRKTHAICPECYEIIPAKTLGCSIYYICPEHGNFIGQVESDESFVNLVGYNRTHDVFNALTINITNECNDKCPLCYYPCGKGHMPKGQVFDLINQFGNKNIWLGGGEPTVHPNILEFVSSDRVTGVLTNGIKFADKQFFKSFIDSNGLDEQGYIKAVISLQPSNLGIKQQALQNARELGYAFNCAMFSITDVSEVEQIVEFWKEWQDVIIHIRIRTPMNAWAQKEERKQIYLSDIHKELVKHLPEYKITEANGGNSIYATTYEYVNRWVMTCSAPHYKAFDIDAVQYAPQQLALDGKAYPTPMALVLNQKGKK